MNRSLIQTKNARNEGPKVSPEKPNISFSSRFTSGLQNRFRYEKQLWQKAFFSPSFFALLLFGLLVLGLAWQVGFSYQFNPEGDLNLDEPFFQGFFDTEHTPRDQPDGFYYRWSRGSASLNLPAVGKNSYLFKFRALGGPNPAPEFSLYANETLVATGRLEPGPLDFEFKVPALALTGKNGELNLRWEVKNFQVKGDDRKLGFALLSAQINPTGEGGFVIPPFTQLGYLLAVIAFAYLICARAGANPRLSGLIGAGMALVLAYPVASPGARIWLALFSSQLVFAFGLALFCLVLADIPLRKGWEVGWEKAWVLAIFGFSLALKLAAILHPQARLIDIGFHEHNFIALWQNGEWFRKISSAEWGNRETFYPPTTYVFAGLFQWLIPDKILLLKIWMVVVESSRCLLVFYLIKKTVGDSRAAVIGAYLMAVMPVAVLSITWGQVANLFGEWLMLAALTVIATSYNRLGRAPVFLGLTFLLLAAFVQHPGVILLSGLVFLIITLIMALVPQGRGNWPKLLGSYGLALALSFAIYHWKTVQEMVPQALDTLNTKLQGGTTGLTPGKVSGPSGWNVGGSVKDTRLGFVPEYVQTLPELVLGGLKGFWREARVYYAVLPLFLVPGGLGWLWFSSAKPPGSGSEPEQPREGRRRLFWLLAAWLFTGILFALVGLVLNLYVRYSLFLLPLVSIGAALALSRLWVRTGRWGALLTVLLGIYLALSTLLISYDRIIYSAHGA